MNFITWLFVGSISGGVANRVLRIDDQSNLRTNLVVGVIGAIIAGIFITPFFGIETINQRTFSLPSMLVALGGAIVLLLAVYIFRWFRANAN